MTDVNIELKPFDTSNQTRIVVRDLSYTIGVKKKDASWKISKCCQETVPKTILHNVDAVIEPGELTAIMGPSGSGKTTFMNILSGRIKNGITGDILLNNEIYEDIGKISGYVKQQDLLLSSSTVREALTFSALLRLPRDMSRKEKMGRVEVLIGMLGLTKCADTRIGDESKRGVSGGELKRVSIGCELIINPRLLFLDEPTSGLDSTSAYNVMNLLKSLSVDTNCSVITTIHQPNANIFNLFDRLIMFIDGKIIFQGPPNEARDFFAQCGHECPPFTNQPDFFMDVIMDTLPESERSLNAKDVPDMIKEFNESDIRKKALKPSKKKLEPMSQHNIKNESASFLTQFSQLCKRSWRDNVRNPLIFQAEFFQHVFLGLLMGLIYFQLGSRDEDTRRDRAAAIFFIIINATYPPAMTASMIIPKQRPIFNREREAGAYGLLSHYLSTFVVSLPFQLFLTFVDLVICYWMIGFNNKFTQFLLFFGICLLLLLVNQSIGIFISSFCPTAESAATITSLVILLFMSFGGFLVKPRNVPKYFIPLDFLTPFKYAYRSLLVTDLRYVTPNCQPILGPCPVGCNIGELCEFPCEGDGMDLLREMGLDDSTIAIDVGILIGMLLIYKLLTYLVLLAIPVRRKQ